jgi:hypothetical protein
LCQEKSGNPEEISNLLFNPSRIRASLLNFWGNKKNLSDVALTKPQSQLRDEILPLSRVCQMVYFHTKNPNLGRFWST